MKPENIKIDDVEYVRKDAVPSAKFEDYVIVRTTSAGCFFGHLSERNGKEVLLRDARRLWYWDGAASLSQMAIDGVSRPKYCKFPAAVAEITLTEAIEIIPCTEKAVESLRAVPRWKA